MENNLPKVVAVIDSYTVAINRGTNDMVKVGDSFLIFGLGAEITDPDTGENLGHLELVRGQVKVIHLQERLATAKSSKMERIPGRKRIVEHSSPFRLRIAGEKEHIEYPETWEPVELEGALVGDFARPI